MSGFVRRVLRVSKASDCLLGAPDIKDTFGTITQVDIPIHVSRKVCAQLKRSSAPLAALANCLPVRYLLGPQCCTRSHEVYGDAATSLRNILTNP